MHIIAADALKQVVVTICRAGGSDEREATMVANRLVEANLAGHDSHGVGMIPAYVGSLKTGRLRAGRHISIAYDHGAIMVIDGNDGYGQVVAHEAMDVALVRARETHVTVMALRNAHHIGRVGAWGEMAADAGFVSIHYVNGIASLLVAPHGGSDARFTTNPYCTALPATDKHPRLILDMATSNIAAGKVRVAYNAGKTVPPDSLIDAEGNATNDPKVLFEEPRGAMLAAGLHKGYGLALVCELLAGAMTGGGTFSLARRDGVSIINNMLTIIIDPQMFGDIADFHKEIDDYTDWVKASPPRPGVDEVMVPGDPERKARRERLANGVPVDPQTWTDILEAAEKLGLSKEDISALSE